MKTVFGVIMGIVIVAVIANFAASCNNGGVSVETFNRRIDEINARIDSVRADVAKVWNVARETKVNTDSIKAEVRTLDGKVDEIAKDVKEIKTTTQTIEFKLF